MRKDLFEEFCHEYTREMNRLRMGRRVGAMQARTELANWRRLDVRVRRPSTSVEARSGYFAG
jgi:hypothetical protein